MNDIFGGEDAGFILQYKKRLTKQEIDALRTQIDDWMSRRPRVPLVVGPEFTVHILNSRNPREPVDNTVV